MKVKRIGHGIHNKPFKSDLYKYHKGAKYIDCRGKDADYCDKCGYTNR